ncbi:hypothetical protein TPHA_0L00760 [Tetrapisispora phaffii CBS 4417]|uniref:Protein FMP52, mitochondrial n=1 Tax=Tetrapisispora phaffii (strain ATCC 24235 / CBS 4417 / NBRC 1672 / NRRL Y-8282 / UCD 70-5) TaxID=1071381 RepID=G8BZV4_TETPH|nr:hypothetical protein TPHA_0L00760 [Tetrapisispora phaffii CBS 4417]CCE65432.1 hypothetical protein TPHA_0L00760 [Tetrapisispora phaffii CBS 4417]
MNTFILGATGLCGNAFLKYANKSDKVSQITTITRRKLADTYDNNTKINQIINKNSEEWVNEVPKGLDVVFTSLSTTKGAAGSLENQYKIDHDLNLQLLEKAKENGCKTVVLISSSGANEHSWAGYLKMKGEIERDVTKLGFDHTIILRPGVLLGERDSQNFKGFGNSFASTIGSFLYGTRFQSLGFDPIYGDDVGKVSLHLAENAENAEKVQIIGPKELLNLSKTL